MPTIKVKAYKCNSCGNVWLPRKEGKPVRCGKCKSPYWDKESKKKDETARAESRR